ncbi:NAD(P)/FAD-dependent oxidoreductase [Arthrobacter caoxuetaonis]|uniref:NAD(P)/FAD-dependent oxidoreductase n=1 Tax=Arthrobacter caoxuetaonis TaxID=2886935 RepID=A0A9X1SBZ8_9MICC|nr:NAD(P)/FAD-dependent oxidoreductase [Arthrobacter caoxuetaonis]MCC3298210.1 NAD(P)/FAD-dependent oxidoreductase [Arthrobacter caoxuetaonis]USQ57213.1 NAD(P)/FAD-dependent oxidoreductase [Arthrobacter caoxuetaonis]
MTLRRIVVVGNGIAGLTACDALRSGGFDGGLTVVGAEKHQPYSRPALSKALLHGDDQLSAHQLPDPSHGAEEILGVATAGIDVQTRRVRLDDGTELPYDGLVIASGSSARRLGGADSPELTLRTIEDAVALKDRVAAGSPSVIVVGGGALGMEIASGALHQGCRVTLVSDVQPLTRQLGSHLSGVFIDAARRQGLRFVTAGKARLAGTAQAPAVALQDGVVLSADVVVSAVGDEPNTAWLEGSGVLTGGRLLADSRGRVRPGIVAAGDVAAFPSGSGYARVPLWTSAIEQAKTAALGLLHGDAAPELSFQPYFWTEGFGLSLKAVGPTPVDGAPDFHETGPAEHSALMRWEHPDGSGTAVAVNYRIPVPRLRRLANTGAAAPVPAN